jgi:hypothetical protein
VSNQKAPNLPVREIVVQVMSAGQVLTRVAVMVGTATYATTRPDSAGPSGLPPWSTFGTPQMQRRPEPPRSTLTSGHSSSARHGRSPKANSAARGAIKAGSVQTHANAGAPFTRSIKRSQLPIFSPGGGLVREVYAAQVEELASLGYVAAAISHPFWNGTLATFFFFWTN